MKTFLKTGLLLIIVTFSLIVFPLFFLLPSCERFSIQDTDYLILGGVWELEEIIGADGKPISDNSNNLIPPFIYLRD